ncbi:MAG: type II toxin-antitoxin system RelE/ParE family toxin [Oscillospiraceae bacterium]|nr:type II toxin-antitoxin system RelE/ParE family toxin [Oscillospiraceae bacterium]
MASEYRYQFTLRARDDLDDIVRYISIELSNPAAAASFVGALQEAIHEACLFPTSGSRVENEFLPSINIRKKVIHNYIMYYSPNTTEEVIQILRIIYGRRDMDEILRQLDV